MFPRPQLMLLFPAGLFQFFLSLSWSVVPIIDTELQARLYQSWEKKNHLHWLRINSPCNTAYTPLAFLLQQEHIELAYISLTPRLTPGTFLQYCRLSSCFLSLYLCIWLFCPKVQDFILSLLNLFKLFFNHFFNSSRSFWIPILSKLLQLPPSSCNMLICYICSQSHPTNH